MSDDAPIPVELRPSALIRVSDDGSWEPDPEGGFDALLMPVRAMGGAVIDTVAWELGYPDRWWLRRNVATFVGEYEILLANAEKRPVKLVETPKEYLTHWGYAVCILNWSADVRAILASCDQGVVCSTTALLGRVQRAVNQKRSDRLRITVAA